MSKTTLTKRVEQLEDQMEMIIKHKEDNIGNIKTHDANIRALFELFESIRDEIKQLKCPHPKEYITYTTDALGRITHHCAKCDYKQTTLKKDKEYRGVVDSLINRLKGCK